MIQVQMNSAALQVSLGEILAQARRPRAMLYAAAGAVRKYLQVHFKDRDRTPNKLGGERTHFWLDVYRSTQLGEVTDSYSTVVIGDTRFTQKVYGGRITAKNVRNLSIPLVPEAHGRRPAVFEQETGLKLFLIKSRGGIFLATRAAESKFLEVVYLLRPFVDQDADPDALPPWEDVEQAALAAAEAQLQTEIQRAQSHRN